mgnify:CR=1 FL=1
MERRRFIRSAGLVGILATGAAPAVHAKPALRWRLASSFPKTLEITHGSAHFFAREVRDMSGGKFEIDVHSADELLPAFDVLDSVQRGTVECGHTAAYYYIDRDETFALDCAIPFGLNARQMAAWLRHGNGLNLLREFYLNYGIVNFPMGNSGAQMGGWYRKPINSPADLKGLKMRITGLGGKVFARLGGIPVNLPGAEIYPALERGMIHAAEWVGPYDDLKLGLHKLKLYYAYPGWWEGSTQLSLYVNRRAYDALTAENKAIIKAAATAAHCDMLTQYDAKNPLALKELIAIGARLTPFPKTVLDAAHQAADELYAELAEKNPHWKRIYGSYAAFLRDQTWSWSYTEMAFENYRLQRLSEQLKTTEASSSKNRRDRRESPLRD